MTFARPILLLLILGAADCALPTPADPAASVVPYSYDLQKTEPFPAPFVVRFAKGGRSLFFVAAVHGCDPGTFRLIDDVLAANRIRSVVFEGWPSTQGVNPPEYSRKFPEWAVGAFCRGGGEEAYAAVHASERGASFIGGEPDERAVVQAVLREGFTPEDLLGFYFVRQVPQFRREGAFEARGLEECFRSLIRGMAKRAGLEDAAAGFSLERFDEWYREKQGKTFSLATMEDSEADPLLAGPYFSQRVSGTVSLVRDRFIVRVIASQIASEKVVLVVYGGSHFLTERPALEAMMGKPVEIKSGTRPSH